uniref:Fe2OG dioxygenase domain-containing protein n=1 Tax=Kalanchoe fedtschenkoi TaxID=63787 RepID=A0A7N0UIR7_KALFE
MDDRRKTLLREVFGESSDEENDHGVFQYLGSVSVEAPIEQSDALIPSWTRIDELPGLWLCKDFISVQEQASLLLDIDKEGWFSESSSNQAMRFGDLPQWALELSIYIRDGLFNEHDSSNGHNEALSLPLKLWQREPLFDQLIVNMYQPGEGICAHVDLMRFEDGIAIVSLESSCIMHFSPVEGKASENMCLSETKIPVHLTPGSLVLLSGEARYHWKHEINREPGFQIWNGREISQKRRISITLRKLCPS